MKYVIKKSVVIPIDNDFKFFQAGQVMINEKKDDKFKIDSKVINTLKKNNLINELKDGKPSKEVIEGFEDLIESNTKEALLQMLIKEREKTNTAPQKNVEDNVLSEFKIIKDMIEKNHNFVMEKIQYIPKKIDDISDLVKKDTLGVKIQNTIDGDIHPRLTKLFDLLSKQPNTNVSVLDYKDSFNDLQNSLKEITEILSQLNQASKVINENTESLQGKLNNLELPQASHTEHTVFVSEPINHTDRVIQELAAHGAAILQQLTMAARHYVKEKEQVSALQLQLESAKSDNVQEEAMDQKAFEERVKSSIQLEFLKQFIQNDIEEIDNYYPWENGKRAGFTEFINLLESKEIKRKSKYRIGKTIYIDDDNRGAHESHLSFEYEGPGEYKIKSSSMVWEDLSSGTSECIKRGKAQKWAEKKYKG
jgi:hypothetical protein